MPKKCLLWTSYCGISLREWHYDGHYHVCADEGRLGHEGHPPAQPHRVGPFRDLRAPVCTEESVEVLRFLDSDFRVRLRGGRGNRRRNRRAQGQKGGGVNIEY